MPVSKKVTNSEPFIFRSPDGKKNIDIKNSKTTVSPLTINIEGREAIIINEKFSVTVSSNSSVKPSLPLVWLDNESLLTQKRNGHLVKVKLDGTITALPEISCKDEDFPYFRRSKSGDLIYRCSSEEFLIDAKNDSIKKIKPDLDFGFSNDIAFGETIYYFENREIGRGGIDVSTTEGYLALTFGIKNKNGFYDSNNINTVKIWNRFTNEWQDFRFNGSHLEILGWYIEVD